MYTQKTHFRNSTKETKTPKEKQFHIKPLTYADILQRTRKNETIPTTPTNSDRKTNSEPTKNKTRKTLLQTPNLTRHTQTPRNTQSYPQNQEAAQPTHLEGRTQSTLNKITEAFEILRRSFEKLVSSEMTHINE